MLAIVVILAFPCAAAGAQTPQAAKAEAEAEAAIQGDLGHPYNLPPASRAKMHTCGIEWQKMKLSGAADEKTWRLFASQCLIRPEGKAPNASDTDKAR